ncbi:cobalt transporter [Mycolicibacterium cosmeticum]|uniref:Integral membrane protein n=1 Tax=Mycolicibacterium cosmeticum TaxID=258533 RepID=W9B827_MYCCO|nr:CbtA family protein [Mycolicibacterium cosmeticum]TLH74132.1 cobalt transporter [Mycolicibacterium cosmeticum]CDO11082.1 putative integral membrane protein [Mycolicibacterium cosmeticum]
MPLNAEIPPLVRYLVPGLAGGVISVAFSRVMIEPLIGTAVDYEVAREHAQALLTGDDHLHGHELFSRSVQESLGAAVGIIAMAVAMGVLFAVAYTVLRTVLAALGFTADSTGLSLVLAGAMFAAVNLVPGLKYPPNPPTVGLEETIGVRSSAFLMVTVVSVVGACVAVAAGLALSRRWGSWPAAAVAVGIYGVVILAAFAWLPSFHEVPGPMSGPAGVLVDGFPAEVLGEFRVYSVLNQALMWLTIGATWGCLSALSSSTLLRNRRRAVADRHE